VTRSWPAPWPARSEPRPEPPDEAPDRELVGATDGPVVLTGEVQDASVGVDRRALESRARKGPAHHRAYLDLEDVDAAENPGIVYAVYVNLPKDPTSAELARHHVGNLSLFGVERARDPRGDAHAHRLRVSMEITDVLDRLAESGEWQDGERIDVTFRRLELEAPEDPPEDDDDEAVAPTGDAVQVGRISVHYA
jgi:tyrosinase